MQLFFIRHAQSENNAQYNPETYPAGRQADPTLTVTGFEQAERLATYLAERWNPAVQEMDDSLNHLGYHFTHIYTSLMGRSVQTAAILSARLGLPMMGWVDLHERGGLYLDDPETREKIGHPGHSRSYFQRSFPDLGLPDEVNEAGWWNRPAEKREEVPQRAQRVIAQLFLRHGEANDRVALVSHGGFYNSFLDVLLGIPGDTPPEEGALRHWFKLNNTAFTRFDITEKIIDINYMNRAEHLPLHLLT